MKKETFQSVVTSAGVIAGFSLLSRALGLLRDRLLAGSFGAGPVLDSYYAAFKIPDFLFNLLVLGALTAAFVPVVGGYLARHNHKEANRVTSAVINLLLLGMVVLSGLAFLFIDPLMRLVAPGFSGATLELATNLTRVMLLSPIIFGLASVVASYLNTVRRFVAFSVAPVLYNVGIIVGILWFVPWLGPMGLAYGVILGALLNLIVQIPSLFSGGFRYTLRVPLNHPAVIKIIKLAGPRVVSIAALQINVVIVTAVATTLSSGTVTAYNLAFNLQSLPMGVVGLSLATAIFPVLAAAASQKESKVFVQHISQTLRQMLFLILPLSVFFILLARQIVDLALKTGAFNVEDAAQTAWALAIFSVSLFAQSIVPLLTRAFYALEDTKTPVAISLFTVVINIVAVFLLGPRYSVLGLAWAFSLSAVLDLILHYIFLKKRLGALDDQKIWRSTLNILVATILSGGTLYVAERGLNLWWPGESFVVLLLKTASVTVIASLAYLLVHWLLASSDLPQFLSAINIKKHKT